MGKKAEFYELAERRYIQEDCSFDEIAKHFGLSDKTVREWADKGDWRARRETFRKERVSVNERMVGLSGKVLTLTEKLVDTILQDWNAGQTVDPGRLYAMTRLLDRISKARQVDQDVKADQKQPGDDQGGLSDDVLAKLEQQLKLL